MNNTKETRAKWTMIISALSLTILIIAELFLMINFDSTIVIYIILLAVLALAAVYMLVNSIMTLEAEKEAKRQAHFDNLYKSEKASYIMLKNKFREIEEKLASIQESSKIPSEEIINAQKGIAKVIINRNKENADAIINSNDQVLERLDEMDETQNTKFTGISKDQRLKLQDMVVQLKDMELRLNQAIMQNAGARPENQEQNFFEPEEISVPDEISAEDEISADTEISADEVADVLSMLESLDDLSAEPVEDAVAVEDIIEDFVEDMIVETPIEVTAPAAPEIDLSDPNKALSADDIAALFASMAGDTPAEEPAEEIVEEPVVEDIPPMPDLSDPNRALSPDEIAALIANL